MRLAIASDASRPSLKSFVGRIDRGRHGEGLEEAEQGPELVLDDERVPFAAARRDEKDRRAAQRRRIDDRRNA